MRIEYRKKHYLRFSSETVYMSAIKDVNLEFICPEQLPGDNLPCTRCSRKVVDFTHATPAALEEAQQKASGPICGKFSLSQLSDKMMGYAAAFTLAAGPVTVQAEAIAPATEPVELKSTFLLSHDVEYSFYGFVVGSPATPLGGVEQFQRTILDILERDEHVGSGRATLEFRVGASGNIVGIQLWGEDVGAFGGQLLRALADFQHPFSPAKRDDAPITSRVLIPITIEEPRPRRHNQPPPTPSC